MLSKNLVSSVLTQIPVFILGVASGVFSTRILGDDSKGLFSLFQANSQLFVLVFSLGIQTGIVYFISSKKISADKVAGISFYIFSIASGILVLFLILAYALGLTDFFLPAKFSSIVYLVILFLMYLFSFVNSILASFFQAYSKFKVVNLISIINGVFNALVFAILFFVLEKQSLSSSSQFNLVLWATLFMLIFNLLLWLYYFKKNFSIWPDFKFNTQSELKPFISYNLLIYTGMFINFFNYRLDLWIVNHFLTDKELSYYSLAANINQIILYSAVTIGSVLLPNLAGKSDTERINTFTKASRLSFLFFSIIILIAFLTSGFIIPFMYGKDFESTVLPFQIILPGMLFSCITQLFSIFLVAINRNIFNIMACSIGLVFTITLDLILIPRYGILGASFATSISYFLIFIFTYIFILQRMNGRIFNLFMPLKADIIFLQKNFFKKSL